MDLWKSGVNNLDSTIRASFLSILEWESKKARALYNSYNRVTIVEENFGIIEWNSD